MSSARGAMAYTDRRARLSPSIAPCRATLSRQSSAGMPAACCAENCSASSKPRPIASRRPARTTQSAAAAPCSTPATNFYRQWKTGIVRDALRGQGLTPKVWRDPVFLPAGDRRRATFTAIKESGAVILGHHRRRGQPVADIASCLVVDSAIMELRQRLTTLLAPILQDGAPATTFIQAVNGRIEIVITGPVGPGGTPDQTLRAALDWSYRLLLPAEQAVLQGIAIFRATFTFESALADRARTRRSASKAPWTRWRNLVTKSMLAADRVG